MESNIRIANLKDLTIDGKGTYGIAASAVPKNDKLYSYLRITDISEDGTINHESLLSVEDENASKYVLEKNDIVFARTGNSTGKSYFYDGKISDLVYAGFLIKFSIDPNKVNPKYIKYYTMTKDYKGWVQSFSTGSTRNNINAKTYGLLKIPLLPRKKQDKLVEILTRIEEKIECNKNIIANLEALSQTLFKRWFIDFEFPDENGNPYRSSGGKMYNTKLGEIPTKFHPGTLKDLLDIKSGYAFKSSWWEDSGVPVIKIKDIQDNGINLHNLSYVAPSHASKASDFTVSGGEILMALTGATVSKNYVVPLLKEPALVNQRVGLVKGSNSFKYSLLNSKLIRNEIIERAHGSAQPNVSPKNILAINFPIPTVNIIETFVCETKSMYKMIYTKSYENTQLVKLRDDLLPKLMSGELELPEALEV